MTHRRPKPKRWEVSPQSLSLLSSLASSLSLSIKSKPLLSDFTIPATISVWTDRSIPLIHSESISSAMPLLLPTHRSEISGNGFWSEFTPRRDCRFTLSMGTVPSTPRWSSARPVDTAEYLIGTFVGEKSFPLTSDFWQKLLELPLSLQWPSHRVRQACELFGQYSFLVIGCWCCCFLSILHCTRAAWYPRKPGRKKANGKLNSRLVLVWLSGDFYLLGC